jgi:hypothetical protein
MIKIFSSNNIFKAVSLDWIAKTMNKDQVMKVYQRSDDEKPEDFADLPWYEGSPSNGTRIWVYYVKGFFEVCILRK